MINRVVLVGRLTRDPELSKTQSGLSVCSFTVACDRKQGREQSDQQQTADFISCVAWRQSADFISQYGYKGALVGIDGKIQTRNYEDRDGKRVYVTEVVADTVRLLDSRRDREQTEDTYSYIPSTMRTESIKVKDLQAQDLSGQLNDNGDDLPF